jgi:hypothetical protein
MLVDNWLCQRIALGLPRFSICPPTFRRCGAHLFAALKFRVKEAQLGGRVRNKLWVCAGFGYGVQFVGEA